MKKENAEKIGIKAAFKSVSIGIVFFLLLLFVFGMNIKFLIEFDYYLNIILGFVFFYICGFVFGKKSAIEILIMKKNETVVGIKYGIFTLIITAFLFSLVGFFQEGRTYIGTNYNPIEGYIFKPMFWIIFFGIIPTVIMGRFFGKWIKREEVK